MSHFTVLVIGEDYETQLAPYHEFECTGHVDEHVQTVEKTDELLEAYNTSKVDRLMFSDGRMITSYDDETYRDPTPEEQKRLGNAMGAGTQDGLSYWSKDWGDWKGHRPKIHDISAIPVVKVSVPCKEIQTFLEYIREHYSESIPVIPQGSEPDLEGGCKWGWIESDEKGNITRVTQRTNPNPKWDWYVVGGRWSGYFPVKDGAQGKLGEPGVFRNTPEASTADSLRWGDVDIERARQEARDQAHQDFDGWEECFTEHGKAQSWKEILGDTLEKGTRKNVDAARESYRAQATIQAYYKKNPHFWMCPVDTFGHDRDAYVQGKVNQALVPFAVLKDGEWYQRGDMGWWGMVSDEKDPDEWAKQVSTLLDSLDPDTLVTIVDCHI